MVSPQTYQCNLCAITYGNTGMKREWKEFIEILDVPVEFLHRDEFFEQYRTQGVHFPAAFVKREGTVTLFIDSGEINSLKTLKELMG